MPTVKIPIFNPLQRNVEGEELSDKTFILRDGFVDEEGYTVKRPGLRQLLDIGAGVNFPVTGLFWWPQKQCALAICNNKVYKLTYVSSTLAATDITTNGPGTAKPPTFAIGVDSNVSAPVHYGIIAAGGAMIEGHGTNLTISNFATIADGDAPTTVSHVAFIDGYLIALTGKGMFQYSDLNNPTSWAALSFATAMRNPDNIVALRVVKGRIYFFGESSLEVWENDGSSPFAPVLGAGGDYGCIAPLSVVEDDDSLYWLDNNRRIVRHKGGAIEPIGTPFDKEIEQFSSVSDCLGMRVKIGGRVFIKFQFPTEERTLVYTVPQDSWSEWSYYDTTVGEYRHFLGTSYCYCPLWGIHLVGSRTESKIYELSAEVKVDGTMPIRLQRTTGHLDHGTTQKKRSKELRVRMKRGEGLLSGEIPKLIVRWRDDNKRWSNERHISLGKVGETETVVRIDSRGIYRTRQYEFVATDAVSIAFGSVEEDVTTL